MNKALIANSKDNFYLKYIKEVKSRFPEAVIMTDVAMDPYSSDGHDGIVRNGEIVMTPFWNGRH